MKYVYPKNLPRLLYKYFIVTEGMGDAKFIDRLLELRDISTCGVGCPSAETAKSGGKNAFADYFRAIQLARTRIDSVELGGLLVMGDSDDNPAKAYSDIVSALSDAKLPTPEKEFTTKVHADGFKVAIYLIPTQGETGNLEKLLLKALFAARPELEDCIEKFSECSGGLRSANENTLSKMRMSALAAAFCEDNPWCSVANMWSDPKNPVPIDSKEFAGIGDFISEFASQ